MNRVCWCVWLAGCAVMPPADSKGDTDVVDVDTDPVESDTPDDTTPESDEEETQDSAGGPLTDSDGDGVPDRDDNCVDVVNPRQGDLDQDDVGDDCDEDRDGDYVPDDADPWPLDPDWPGIATSETVYAHTSGVLFRFNVVTQRIDRVGAFSGQFSGSATDLAINEWGVLYVISFDAVFICRPNDAQCRSIGTLNDTSNNGLTFLPPGVLGASSTLIAMSGADWKEVFLGAQGYRTRRLGGFGGGSTSSGDAFSIQGVGTFAALNYQGAGDRDTIVRVDPATGAVQGVVVTFPNHSRVYGLAGWTDGFVYAFDESGDVLQVDVAAGSFQRIAQTQNAWWGAGVRTVIPPTP